MLCGKQWLNPLVIVGMSHREIKNTYHLTKLGDLFTGKKYKFRIAARNEYGLGNFCAPILVQTLETSRRKFQRNTNKLKTVTSLMKGGGGKLLKQATQTSSPFSVPTRVAKPADVDPKGKPDIKVALKKQKKQVSKGESSNESPAPPTSRSKKQGIKHENENESSGRSGETETTKLCSEGRETKHEGEFPVQPATAPPQMETAKPKRVKKDKKCTAEANAAKASESKAAANENKAIESKDKVAQPKPPKISVQRSTDGRKQNQARIAAVRKSPALKSEDKMAKGIQGTPAAEKLEVDVDRRVVQHSEADESDESEDYAYYDSDD